MPLNNPGSALLTSSLLAQAAAAAAQDALRELQPITSSHRSHSDPDSMRHAAKQSLADSTAELDWSRIRLESDHATSASTDSIPAPEEPKRLSAELLRQVELAESQAAEGSTPTASRKPRPSSEHSTCTGRAGSAKSSVTSAQVLDIAGPIELDESGRPLLPADSLQEQDSDYRYQLAASFVADTLRAMPCRAEAVSHLR